jgi:hypothetical protein
MDEDEFLDELLSSKDYDYRQAFLEREQPEINPHDKKYHWASKTKSGKWLKSPKHPTAWKEAFVELTGADPDGFNIKGIPEADSVLSQVGLPKIAEYLPNKWEKLSEFEGDKEKLFRNWLRSTPWFKQLYEETK